VNGKKNVVRKPAHPQPAVRSRTVAAAAVTNFNGSVYGFALTGETLYAATSQGVLRSATSGSAWSLVTSVPTGEWRFVAASKSIVVAASLDDMQKSSLELSPDGGKTWKTIALPPKVTQVLALSLDGQGEVWIGGKDGVYFSADQGANWQTPPNMVVRNVNSLYFDDAANRMLVTAKEPPTDVFAIDIPSKRMTSWDTGWNLRFVRPVGDYMVAGTLFDGIVVQPKMVDSAEITKH
jgi:photosystem II stability/assembly factor-like uncharacterized protein